METKQMFSSVDMFEQWLEQEMKRQGIKVPKLSKRSGVHPNTIYNYLARRCDPTWYNACLLVNALGYNLEVVPK